MHGSLVLSLFDAECGLESALRPTEEDAAPYQPHSGGGLCKRRQVDYR